MPMHDWTRVEPNIYHHFQGRWIYTIAAALNDGRMPPGYYALAEQVVHPFGPDVLTLQPREPALPPPPPGSTATLAANPPAAATVARAKPRTRPRRAHRRLSIRHISNHRVVALIELLSPGNKANQREFIRLVDKAVSLLEEGVHLLVIDPFPPTGRDPNGIHAAIWRQLTRKRYERPADRPLTAVSYSAAVSDVVAFVQPFAVGEPVPAMPLFLDPDRYVTVPLEETYVTAWPGVPEVWRRALA